MKIIEEVLQILKNEDFSDILIESGAAVMGKTARGWVDAGLLEYPSMEDVGAFLENLDPAWRETLEKGAINRPIDLHSWRLRINAYLAYGGTKLMCSIRKIPHEPPVLQQTGLPASVRLLLESPSGILLISGSTGSGKTTSMASMVNVINSMRNAHVITIEDPIEFVFRRDKSIFSQREIGVDCASFFDGVKDAMRQRPDVIVIGEIRDRETAEQALLAGESGHLVIGTLHANSAVGTITKMMGFFGANERESRLQSLSGSLVGVIHQTLTPKKDETGYALAVDFLANHKRQYSRFLGDPEKAQGMLDRKEDGVSMGLADSLEKLIKDGVVDKADAAKVVSGNASVFDKIRNL